MRKTILYLTIMLLWFECAAPAYSVPEILWGKWVISRELLTDTISCWSKKDALGLIGTELEYSSVLFRWNRTVVKNPVTQKRVISAKRFHDENSGRGANDSQV